MTMDVLSKVIKRKHSCFIDVCIQFCFMIFDYTPIVIYHIPYIVNTSGGTRRCPGCEIAKADI